MEVKHNPRTKKKGISNHDTNIALTTSKSETIPIEALGTMTVERERWNTQHDSNQYEKVKLTLGHSCVRKGIANHGFIFITIIFIVFIVIILTHTINKINYLEGKMANVEQQITNNINSIKEHHNSTFKHLEQRHNELKNIVKTNTLLIASRGWTNIRSEHEICLSAIIVSSIYFGNSYTLQ